MRKKLIHFSRMLVVTSYYLLVVFPLVVSAAVTLQWDAKCPAPDGYNIFLRVANQPYDYTAPLNSETISGTTYSVNDLQPGVTYYFVVRAITGSSQSADSNESEYTEPAGVVDIDGDGDGMPDIYESATDGLDPLVDDGDGDLDGDHVSNKDEYDNGTDPAQKTNYAPGTPELRIPARRATVSLTPTLATHAFSDVNGDSHAETRYQIALDINFTDLVFDRVSVGNLTRLNLIDLILDPETTYFWRVKFVDNDQGESEWSSPFSFTTVDYAAAGDENANGILDSQEVVDMSVDLDDNQVPDTTQSNLLCVNADDGLNPQVSIKGGNHEVQVVALRADALEDPGRALSVDAPASFTGLISFKLYLDPGVTTASAEVYFTSEAPEDAQYYFNTENGWAAYTEAVFSPDRKSVTITLEDGGDGDQDGVQNGVIVDPAGLGYSYQTVGSASFDTTEQTSCFIATSLTDPDGSRMPGAFAMVWWGLFGWGTMLLLQRQRP